MFAAMKRQRSIIASCASLAAVTFLIGINYCACGELVHGPSHHGHAHTNDASSHHENDSQPQRSEHQFDHCCSTLQAIALAPSNLLLLPMLTRWLHARALRAVGEDRSGALSYVPTGLSPPREPTPHIPFYRTTFANHAPPLFFA